MRAIVIGRNYTSLLGMIRPAGLAGCEVTAIRTVKNLAARMKNRNSLSEDPIEKESRFVTRHYFVEQDAEELIRLLLEKCADGQEKSVILPCDDFAASAVDANRDRLQERFLLPGIRGVQGEIIRYMDKSLQKELAKKAGLNVAQGWLINIQDGKYTIPEDIVYPVFVKPDVSYVISKSFMRRCDNEQELLALIRDVIRSHECPLLAEQFMEFEKEYAVLGVSDGSNTAIPGIITIKSMGHGAHRGVTLVGTYSSLNAFGGLKQKLQALIGEIGLTGLFDIDLYAYNGEVYFNELNLRLGASGFVVMRAGINLPGMLIDCLSKNTPVQDRDYQGEIRFINEKVNLEDYYSGHLSWKQYQENRKAADCGFIEFEADMGPHEKFCKNVKKAHLKRELKNLAGVLGLKRK